MQFHYSSKSVIIKFMKKTYRESKNKNQELMKNEPKLQ